MTQDSTAAAGLSAGALALLDLLVALGGVVGLVPPPGAAVLVPVTLEPHAAKPNAIAQSVAAVSVGVIDGEPRLDLPYEEDVRAGTDMNVVCTGDGRFVEVQGTAEGAVFDRPTLDRLLDLAVAGCAELTRLQADALSSPAAHR